MSRVKPVRIRAVEPHQGHVVTLTFTDGTVRTLDLSEYLRGPVFESILRDPNEFRRVRVDPELGTIVWPNGADLDPDVLYGIAPPAWEQDEDSDRVPEPGRSIRPDPGDRETRGGSMADQRDGKPDEGSVS
jgi:hypothetical protein